MMGFKFGSRYGDEGGNALGAKLQKVKEHLKLLAAKGSPKQVGRATAAGGETIADDTAALADKAEIIRRDEALVREALAMFGVDYEALISPQDKDGKPSVYARAVQANPAVLEQVARDPIPVLAALRVATGYKPFADFTEKYGSTPEDIKAALKAEVMAESGTENVKVRERTAPVFSSQVGLRVAASAKPKGGLKDIFGK